MIFPIGKSRRVTLLILVLAVSVLGAWFFFSYDPTVYPVAQPAVHVRIPIKHDPDLDRWCRGVGDGTNDFLFASIRRTDVYAMDPIGNEAPASTGIVYRFVSSTMTTHEVDAKEWINATGKATSIMGDSGRDLDNQWSNRDGISRIVPLGIQAVGTRGYSFVFTPDKSLIATTSAFGRTKKARPFSIIIGNKDYLLSKGPCYVEIFDVKTKERLGIWGPVGDKDYSNPGVYGWIGDSTWVVCGWGSDDSMWIVRNPRK